MEDRENLEGREERDVIGRKKGPVLASIVLAVILIIFTRGKGFGSGKDPAVQNAETVQVKETTLEEVLSDTGSYEENIPQTVEILVDGALVSVNGWTCRDGEELKDFLTAFGSGRQFELSSALADPDTLQWVRGTFESLSVPCTEAPQTHAVCTGKAAW